MTLAGISRRAETLLSIARALRHSARDDVPALYDIGSRYGFDARWRAVEKLNLVRLVGFEPDAEEAERLQRAFPRATIVPHALGSREGEATLHCTAHPGCSSLLEPSPENFEGYSIQPWLKVKSTLQISLQRLDRIVQDSHLPYPDYLKVDVQGYELEVLKGMGELLRNVSCVELEARFRPMYKGEPALPALKEWMENSGFILRDLKIAGAFDAEAVEADCYFVRAKADNPRQTRLIHFWEALHGLRQTAPAGAIAT